MVQSMPMKYCLTKLMSWKTDQVSVVNMLDKQHLETRKNKLI